MTKYAKEIKREDNEDIIWYYAGLTEWIKEE